MKTRILMAATAALALAACGGDSENEDNLNTMPADNMMMPADNITNAAGEAAMPQNGQEYATMVGAGDMFEIESARLAQEKATSDDIKELAEMIVTDHTTSTEQLRQAASQAQPPVTVEPQLNAEQQANMQALRSANGAQFDQAWLQQQLGAHQKALAMVQHYAQNGDVPSLKQHAGTVAGPIQRHLERVQELQGGQGAE